MQWFIFPHAGGSKSFYNFLGVTFTDFAKIHQNSEAFLPEFHKVFLDDEFEKLKDDPDSRTRQVVDRLFAAINHRVDEAAPLTTKV